MPQRLVAEQHVLDDVQVVAERQVLVDGGDPERGGVRGLCRWTGLPCQMISPASAPRSRRCVLISVDLPAPLSPTSAVTWPAGMSRSMSVSAWTGPKRLPMPAQRSSGWPSAPAGVGAGRGEPVAPGPLSGPGAFPRHPDWVLPLREIPSAVEPVSTRRSRRRCSPRRTCPRTAARPARTCPRSTVEFMFVGGDPRRASAAPTAR